MLNQLEHFLYSSGGSVIIHLSIHLTNIYWVPTKCQAQRSMLQIELSLSSWGLVTKCLMGRKTIFIIMETFSIPWI